MPLIKEKKRHNIKQHRKAWYRRKPVQPNRTSSHKPGVLRDGVLFVEWQLPVRLALPLRKWRYFKCLLTIIIIDITE